jgi:hypothetical protein
MSQLTSIDTLIERERIVVNFIRVRKRTCVRDMLINLPADSKGRRINNPAEYVRRLRNKGWSQIVTKKNDQGFEDYVWEG